jgi:hypothetical protein
LNTLLSGLSGSISFMSCLPYCIDCNNRNSTSNYQQYVLHKTFVQYIELPRRVAVLLVWIYYFDSSLVFVMLLAGWHNFIYPCFVHLHWLHDTYLLGYFTFSYFNIELQEWSDSYSILCNSGQESVS